MATTPRRWFPPLLAAIGHVAPSAAARLVEPLLTQPRGQNEPQAWELVTGDPAPTRRVLGCGVHVLQWGDTGPAILAQHGWRGRTTQFRLLAEALVPRGLRVVAVEGPGHGRTPGAAATPRILADNLLAVAREVGPVAGVIGHSLGGAATGVAIEFGLPADRIVLIGSPTRVSRLVRDFAASLGLPRAALAALEVHLDRHAGRPATQLDLVVLAPRLGVRGLIVHDSDDEVIPLAEARELLDAWPAAESLFTAGLGHRDVLASPVVIERVVDFLLAT
jgi:pimeloyl-ACP methyl ester carboxylesterase